jgi:hypothetical protein
LRSRVLGYPCRRFLTTATALSLRRSNVRCLFSAAPPSARFGLSSRCRLLSPLHRSGFAGIEERVLWVTARIFFRSDVAANVGGSLRDSSQSDLGQITSVRSIGFQPGERRAAFSDCACFGEGESGLREPDTHCAICIIRIGRAAFLTRAPPDLLRRESPRHKAILFSRERAARARKTFRAATVEEPLKQ